MAQDFFLKDMPNIADKIKPKKKASMYMIIGIFLIDIAKILLTHCFDFCFKQCRRFLFSNSKNYQMRYLCCKALINFKKHINNLSNCMTR